MGNYLNGQDTSSTRATIVNHVCNPIPVSTQTPIALEDSAMRLLLCCIVEDGRIFSDMKLYRHYFEAINGVPPDTEDMSQAWYKKFTRVFKAKPRSINQKLLKG